MMLKQLMIFIILRLDAEKGIWALLVEAAKIIKVVPDWKISHIMTLEL